MPEFARTPAELFERAAKYWPRDLTAQEAEASILPILLETPDKFISLLGLADASPTSWKEALQLTRDFDANLFLKHLMVLADIGGEPLQRLGVDLVNIYPTNIMSYTWKSVIYDYEFRDPGAFNNNSLNVSGSRLARGGGLTEKMEDVAMLLLFGGASTTLGLPTIVEEKCVIGTYIGDGDQLSRFVKQRYLYVSRITAGATSNTLGQLAQKFVIDILRSLLPENTGWTFTSNGSIPGVSQNEGLSDVSFDIVAKSPLGMYTGIEVSFQFTTNSVIERKSKLAAQRATILHAAGAHVAYVIDGMGNFQRDAALRDICNASDCTVAFTSAELQHLVNFLSREEMLREDALLEELLSEEEVGRETIGTSE